MRPLHDRVIEAHQILTICGLAAALRYQRRELVLVQTMSIAPLAFRAPPSRGCRGPFRDFAFLLGGRDPCFSTGTLTSGWRWRSRCRALLVILLPQVSPAYSDHAGLDGEKIRY
jgi:hypothetical protein